MYAECQKKGGTAGNAGKAQWQYLCGFTLVELLVVLATIALLASLLLPTFGRARDQARLTVCRSRLHNLGIGTLLYAEVNDSYLPVDDAVDNPHSALIGLLNSGQYVGDWQNYYCPSARRSDLSMTPDNFDAGRISYFYYSCRAATKNPDIATFLRWEVEYPRLLRHQMSAQTWVISDAWYSGERTAHRYFKKGINHFRLGGTVQMVQSSPRGEFK